MPLFACPGGCAPSAQYGVPASKADPWGQVRHDHLEVVLALFCVDPREACQVPCAEQGAKSFRGDVGSGCPEGAVDVVLCLFFHLKWSSLVRGSGDCFVVWIVPSCSGCGDAPWMQCVAGASRFVSPFL